MALASATAVTSPPLSKTFLELRAILEVAALVPAHPLLRVAPRGDGHPVLVMPGFMTADRSTHLLRKFLAERGFSPYAWELGMNPGISEERYQLLEARLGELHEEHGSRASLVGWSLGGIYARALAHRAPELVRQVVTLGSPFNIPAIGGVSDNVARLYERLNPGHTEDPMLQYAELWKQPTPVPSTSIYSEGDGVAHWEYCLDEENDTTENLRIPGSHVGMTHNPLVMFALAERLSQREGEWRRIDSRLGTRLLYGRQPH